MPSQIFQRPPPLATLRGLLQEEGAEKRGRRFIFSKATFKRAKLSGAIEAFCSAVSSYYYPSKRFYLTRKMNYKGFITLIRQICKYHSIPFTSTIKYARSDYEIIYSIFLGLSEQ